MRKHKYDQAGERHPQAKLTEAFVIQLRRRARKRRDVRGWMRELADLWKVSLPTLLNAVGGDSWRYLNAKEPPVKAGRRHLLTGGRTRSYPLCPACGCRKGYRRGNACTNRFHDIDHRAFSSPRNARIANLRRASKQRARV